MKAKVMGWFIVALWPLQAWGIGFVYTGVGGREGDLLELTSVEVGVNIQDRVAVTRTDQVFTNHSNRVVEGIYEFALPPGAIITDLVLWIGDKRIQGQIMEKEEARQAYDDIVQRNVDPALVEFIGEDRFRLSIFPFPAHDSRRVELEYTQVLESRRGVMNYTFPLAPETDQPIQMEVFILRVAVRGQHAFDVTTAGAFEQITSIDQLDAFSTNVFFGDEGVSPERDFEMTISENSAERLPTVLSYAPLGDAGMGYYALWLPPLRELTAADPIPRSLTFVIDISSSMQGDKLAAAKGALTDAIQDLHSDDFFNIIVFSSGADEFAENPVPATLENIEDAVRFIDQQGAFGLTNFQISLQQALQQSFPGGSLNHVIFLTDGNPTVGESDLSRLSQLVEDLAPDGIRLFTIGVGADVNRVFLRTLAEEHRGSSRSLAAEGDIEAALRDLFEEFTRPIFLPSSLVFGGVDTQDVYPRGVDLLAEGQELFQVGLYQQGGAFTLQLNGRVQDSSMSMDYPLEFAALDRSQDLIPRLWAHQKVQALEDQIARHGTQPELLQDILQLGLEYRLVTRMTSLFAPDEEVIVNPSLDMVDWGDGAATAVEEELATASWLGKDFYWRDDVWVDMDFSPGMDLIEYRAAAGHPPKLEDFAQLNQDMVVVVQGRAYQLNRGTLPAQPLLQQNIPNPFNPSTVIPYQIPVGMEGKAIRLAIYNLAGQQVRTLAPVAVRAGENHLMWDGKDAGGQDVSSGVYLYRLQVGSSVSTRRMMLIR
jgi:hypothetical protein